MVRTTKRPGGQVEEKKRMSTGWKVLIVTGCVLLVLILVGAGGFIWITSGLSRYKKMPIGKVELSKVKDGSYTGSFNGGRWSNTVQVTVKDHKITSVKIVKDVQFADDAKTRQLFDRVVEAQTPQVDAISGSTVTSKAFLKSIENALNAKQ
jgi:uncharacterized protein with FMN-binding domain